MASRDGGRGFIWFVIGLLSGVAATLTVLIFFGARGAQPEPAAPVSVTASVSHSPHKAMLRRPPAEDAPASDSPSAVDAQVAEDAAATGMTSRSRRHTDQ